MATLELTEETLGHLKRALQLYIWTHATDEDLDLLHADRFQHQPYQPPTHRTNQNTKYLDLLAHIFDADSQGDRDSAERTACFMEAARLRNLSYTLYPKSLARTTAALQLDWLEEKNSSEDEDFKIVLKPERKQVEIKDVSDSEKKTSRSRSARVLTDAIIWWSHLQPNGGEDQQLLRHVYDEDDVNIDRSQFSDAQRQFLISAFEKYRVQCYSMQDTHSGQLCTLELIRLKKEEPESKLEWSRMSQPTSVDAAPVSAIVMEPPPVLQRSRVHFRSGTQWCRDFVEMARASMPRPSAEEVSPAQAQLYADLKQRLPARIRSNEQIDEMVSLMCSKYTLSHLLQVLTLMGDM